MPPPRFLRRDPDGADVFSSEDGAEVRVASGASPYAQSLRGGGIGDLAGSGLEEARMPAPDPHYNPQTGVFSDNSGRPVAHDLVLRRDQPMATWDQFRQSFPDQQGAPSAAPSPPATDPLAPVLQRFSRTLTLDGGQGSSMPAPTEIQYEDIPAGFGGGDTGALEAPQPPPGTPAEWLAQPPPAFDPSVAHAPQPTGASPAPMASAARSLIAADPSPRPPSLPTYDPGTPGAPVERSTQPLDLTGGASGGAAGARRLGSGGSRGRGPVTASPPSLDALMVPGGYQDPTPAIAGDARSRMLDRGEALIDQAGSLAEQRAQAQRQAADMVRQTVEEGERRRVELEQERQRATGEARARFQRSVDRVSAMNIDPQRVFRQPADVVGAAIAIAFGAAASAISGDQSHQQNAVQMIQSHIDRDIEAQRANIGHAEAGLAAEESILQQTMAEFDSREAAEQAARAAMLEAVAQRIAAMEADIGTDEARLQAEQLRYDFQAQAQEAAAAAQAAEQEALMARALQMARLERIQLQNAQSARRLMGGGGTATPEAPDAATMAQYNQLTASGVDPAEAARSLGIAPQHLPRGGVYAGPTTGEQAGTVAALSTQLDALEGLLPRDTETDIPGHGYTAALPDFMVSEQGRAIRQQLGATIELLGRLHSGGAISDDEFTRFRSIIGGDTDEGLRRGIGIIRRELASRSDRRVSTQGREEVASESLNRVGAERVE